MTAATRKARSAAAIARLEGSSPTFRGVQIEAVVSQRVEEWLNGNGGEVREYRYEALIPADQISTAPAAGDVLIDGAASYTATHPGLLEHGFWRVPLRKTA